jgi:phosphoglycolate phosphatase
MTALAETGCDPADAVMIGDTEFDLQMAAAAGIPAIGVSWGYHEADRLHRQQPVAVLDDASTLTRTILETLGVNDE